MPRAAAASPPDGAGRRAVRLRADEAAPLLHALIARAADELGIRVLAIKGPAVAVQGLRAERASADVDVLLHPVDLSRFVDGMVALGWHRGVADTRPTVMAQHSVNLLSDWWPIGIDMHHYFPGFLADPGQVFDALWARHEDVHLAGVPVPACDRVGHVALVALNLLRSDPTASGTQLADLTDRASHVLPPADRDALVELAHQTDATATLEPFLLALGVPKHAIEPARNTEALELWDKRVLSDGSWPWVMLLARTPKLQWPRTAWRALVLTDEELRTHYQVPPGQGSVASLRWRRIRRGLRRMPRTVWEGVRQERRRPGR